MEGDGQRLPRDELKAVIAAGARVGQSPRAALRRLVLWSAVILTWNTVNFDATNQGNGECRASKLPALNTLQPEREWHLVCFL
jgi:hypothetical protein